MWALGLVIMVDQIDQNVVRGVVPQLKEAFGVDDAAIGLLLSAFVLVNGLVTVPAGYLADRWNRSRTIGHTVVGWSVITMLTAAAGNLRDAGRAAGAARLRAGDHRAVGGEPAVGLLPHHPTGTGVLDPAGDGVPRHRLRHRDRRLRGKPLRVAGGVPHRRAAELRGRRDRVFAARNPHAAPAIGSISGSTAPTRTPRRPRRSSCSKTASAASSST